MRPDESTVLDLGCGGKKREGAFGVDIRDLPGVDLVHNLDTLPWPLPSDHFMEIHCQDIIEHIDAIEPFLRELFRISAKGSSIRIRTPHYSSWYAYNDPTHRHSFGYFFLDHFCATPGGGTIVSKPLFEYRSRHLIFGRAHRLCGASFLANRNPARYEQLFSWMFPCENMLIEITPIKE